MKAIITLMGMLAFTFSGAMATAQDSGTAGAEKTATEKKEAPKVKFKWNKSEKPAFEQAKATGLPVAILFTGTSWCGWCVKLEKEILSKKEFKEGMNDVAIGLICVCESPGQYKGSWAKDLAKKYSVSGVPKIVVVDPEGKVLGTTGYIQGWTPEKYVEFFKSKRDSIKK